MSKENRPNLNAVGLMCDIYSSLEKRRRGPAGKVEMAKIVDLLSGDITKFVEHIDEELNLFFGTKFNDSDAMMPVQK